MPANADALGGFNPQKKCGTSHKKGFVLLLRFPLMAAMATRVLATLHMAPSRFPDVFPCFPSDHQKINLVFYPYLKTLYVFLT